jgi:hypothetical protein
VQISELVDRHEKAWRILWRAYLEFYDAELSDSVTDNTW